MPECGACGATLGEGSAFCNICGASQSQGAVESIGEDSQTAPTLEVAGESPKGGGSHRRTTVLVAVAIASLLLFAGVGYAIKVGMDRQAAQEQAKSKAQAEAAAKAQAEAARKAQAEAAAKAQAEAAAKAQAEAARKAALPYSAISARDFALICKNPDSYVGRDFTVWGEVTQFDAATGLATFRANTGATKRPIEYKMTDYGQNTMLNGEQSVLADLVQGDCFSAKVIVKGSYSYDTQAGGNTTVPSFEVVSIGRYGSTN